MSYPCFVFGGGVGTELHERFFVHGEGGEVDCRVWWPAGGVVGFVCGLGFGAPWRKCFLVLGFELTG